MLSMLSMLAMIAVLTFLRAPTAISAKPEQASTLRARLQAQVSEYRLNDADFAHGLAATASKFNLPMGIEWAQSSETLKKISRSWENTTVQNILVAIVKSQPGYRLEIDDDIIHVYLTRIRSNQKSFLDLKVDDFELKKQVVEIGNRQLREVVKSNSSPSPHQPQRKAGMGYSQATNIGDPEFSLSLRNASVRQIIDKLALASDRKVWIVTYTGITVDPRTGYRRTMTLWNESSVPDSEQPIWDMFRWSDNIPQT